MDAVPEALLNKARMITGKGPFRNVLNYESDTLMFSRGNRGGFAFVTACEILGCTEEEAQRFLEEANIDALLLLLGSCFLPRVRSSFLNVKKFGVPS